MEESITTHIEGKLAKDTLKDVSQKRQQIGALIGESNNLHNESLKKALKDPKASKEDMDKAMSLQDKTEKLVGQASDQLKVLEGWKKITPDNNQKPEEN